MPLWLLARLAGLAEGQPWVAMFMIRIQYRKITSNLFCFFPANDLLYVSFICLIKNLEKMIVSWQPLKLKRKKKAQIKKLLQFWGHIQSSRKI